MIKCRTRKKMYDRPRVTYGARRNSEDGTRAYFFNQTKETMPTTRTGTNNRVAPACINRRLRNPNSRKAASGTNAAGRWEKNARNPILAASRTNCLQATEGLRLKTIAIAKE